MRKVTREVGQAFLAGMPKTVGNSTTDGQAFYLHGHKIAWTDDNLDLWISMCGYGSVTTRDRINGILELAGSSYRVNQHNYVQQLRNWRTQETVDIDTYDKIDVSDRNLIANLQRAAL